MADTAVTPQLADWLVTRTAGGWRARLAAALIRWATARGRRHHLLDAPVNHAALFVGPTDEYPEGAIIEARPGGVGYNSVNAYPDAIWCTGRLAARLTPTPAQREAIAAAARDLIGTPYGYLDDLIAGLAQPRLGAHVTGREWWVKRLTGRKRLECAQAVDIAWREGGVALFPGRLPGLIVPEDMYLLLEPAP